MLVCQIRSVHCHGCWKEGIDHVQITMRCHFAFCLGLLRNPNTQAYRGSRDVTYLPEFKHGFLYRESRSPSSALLLFWGRVPLLK